MNTTLKMIVPVLVGMLPVLGAEQPGIIEDLFFTKDNTARSISRVIESGPKIMALVSATDEKETKNKLVEALCATIGWQNNDPEHYAQEIVKAQVLCGTDLLEKEHVKALKTKYDLLNESELRTLNGNPVKDNYEPLVGEKVVVSKAQEYKRPDGSIYKEAGTELYYLMLEETKKIQPAFRHCQREWEIFSQWKRKTRHQVQTYLRTDVTYTLLKVMPASEEKVVLSTNVEAELTPALYEPEVPTCGHGAFPANYKIVNSVRL